MIRLKLQIAKPDFVILGLTLAFVLFGLLAIFDASSVVAQRDFGNKFYYLQNQIIWASLGLVSLTLFSLFDYHKLAKLAPFGLIIILVLLVLVLIPQIGGEVLGAKRRLEISGIIIQPSEVTKLIYLVFLAFRFSKFSQKPFSLWQFLLVTSIILLLVILEPNLGTAVIIGAIGFLIYFLTGAPVKHFVFLGLIFVVGLVVLIFTAEYRLARFSSFLNLGADPQGISYHQNQILLGLATGGLTGTGLGQSLQKFYYLPEAPTDSIFAVIGEEFGFLGAAAVILAFVVFLFRGAKIFSTAPDDLGKLIAAGIIFLISLQVIVNIAGQVALLPLTGVPLPFISYGGSSLITFMSAVGILLNISKQRVAAK